MSVVLFSALSAHRFSMSDIEGETIAYITLNPKRGHTIVPVNGHELTGEDHGHAKAFTTLQRRARRG